MHLYVLAFIIIVQLDDVVMGLIDYIKNIMTRRKETVPSTYKKIRCNVCNQVCYNQRDLELHMKYNHPDVASTEAS
jgi:RNase P subunit RPR2